MDAQDYGAKQAHVIEEESERLGLEEGTEAQKAEEGVSLETATAR